MNQLALFCLLAAMSCVHVFAMVNTSTLPCGTNDSIVTLTEHNATGAVWSLTDCFERTVVLITSAACADDSNSESCAGAAVTNAEIFFADSVNVYLRVVLVQLVNVTITVSNVSYFPTNESTTTSTFTHAAVFLRCKVSGSIVLLTAVDSTRNRSTFSVGLLEVDSSDAVGSTFAISNAVTVFSPTAGEWCGVEFAQSVLSGSSAVFMASVTIVSHNGSVTFSDTLITSRSHVIIDSLHANANVASALNFRAGSVNSGGLSNSSSLQVSNSALVSSGGDGLKLHSIAILDAHISIVNLTAASSLSDGMVIFGSALLNVSMYVAGSALHSAAGDGVLIGSCTLSHTTLAFFNASLAGTAGRGLFISSTYMSRSMHVLDNVTVSGGFAGMWIQTSQFDDNSSIMIHSVVFDGTNYGMVMLFSWLMHSTLTAESSTFAGTIGGMYLQSTTLEASSAVSLFSTRHFAVSGNLVGFAVFQCTIDGTSTLRLLGGLIGGTQVALQVAQSEFRNSSHLDIVQMILSGSAVIQLIDVFFVDSTFLLTLCSGTAVNEHFLLFESVVSQNSSVLIDRISATGALGVVAVLISRFDSTSMIRVWNSSLAGLYGVYVAASVLMTVQLLSSTIRSNASGVLYEHSSFAAAAGGSCCIQMVNTTVASTSSSVVDVRAVLVASPAVLLKLDSCNVTSARATVILIMNVTIAPSATVVLVDAVNSTIAFSGSSQGSPTSLVNVSFLSLMLRSNVSLSICSSVLLLARSAFVDDCFVCFYNVSTRQWVSEDWIALIGAKLDVTLAGVVLLEGPVVFLAHPSASAVRLSGVALEAVTVSALDVNSSSASFISVRSAAVFSTRIYTADSTWGTPQLHKVTAPTSITTGVDSVVVFSYSMGMSLTVTIVRCDGFGSGMFPVVSILDVKMYDVSSGIFQRTSLYPVDLTVVESRFSGFTALLYRLATVPLASIPEANVTVLCSLWGILELSSMWAERYRRFEVADISGVLPAQLPVNVTFVNNAGCGFSSSSSLLSPSAVSQTESSSPSLSQRPSNVSVSSSPTFSPTYDVTSTITYSHRHISSQTFAAETATNGTFSNSLSKDATVLSASRTNSLSKSKNRFETETLSRSSRSTSATATSVVPMSTSAELLFSDSFSTATASVVKVATSSMSVRAVLGPQPLAPVLSYASTQSLLTATSAASVLSGTSLGDASALAALFMTTCGGFREWDATDSGIQQYVLSPFFALGATASAVGNLGLIGGVFALHWSAVTLVRLRQSSRSQQVSVSAAELLRFPSASHRLAAFLLPGALFASCHAASLAAVSGVVAGAFGVAAGVFVVGAALRVSWWVRDSNIAHCSVVRDRRVADLWVPSVLLRRLVARTLWVPAGVSQQYGSFFSSVSQRAFIPAQILLQYHGAVFSLIAAIPFRGSGQCAAQFALLGAWCLVPAALVGASGFTLMRRPLSNPLAFTSHVLTAVLVVVTGVQTAIASPGAALVSEIVGVLLSVVGAVSAVYSVFCLAVERVLSAGVLTVGAGGARLDSGFAVAGGHKRQSPHVTNRNNSSVWIEDFADPHNSLVNSSVNSRNKRLRLEEDFDRLSLLAMPRSLAERRRRLQQLVRRACSSVEIA